MWMKELSEGLFPLVMLRMAGGGRNERTKHLHWSVHSPLRDRQREASMWGIVLTSSARK